MSVEALTWAFKAPLPPTLKLVLLSYADRADEEGSCRPSVKDTMRRTGLSDRAIRLANTELTRLGMLRVEAHYADTRRQTANRYYLSIDATPMTIPAAPDLNIGEAETHAGGELDADPAPDAGGDCTTCTPSPAPDTATPLHHVQTNRTVRKEPSLELPLEPSPALPRDDVREAFDLWNKLARAAKLPVAEKLNPKRQREIKARLKDGGGLAGWRKALDTIWDTPFLRGETSDWCANLDFVCQSSSYVKLLEGAYGRGNGARPATPAASTTHSTGAI